MSTPRRSGDPAWLDDPALAITPAELRELIAWEAERHRAESQSMNMVKDRTPPPTKGRRR